MPPTSPPTPVIEIPSSPEPANFVVPRPLSSSRSLLSLPLSNKIRASTHPISLPRASSSNSPPKDASQSLPMPDEEETTVEDILARVLEVIPNVEPEYAFALCRELHPQHQNQAHEYVLHALFEKPDYPKIDTRKRKRNDEDDVEGFQGKGKAKAVKIDYFEARRPFTGGPNYTALSMIHLQQEFPYVPVPYIRQIFFRSSLFAPAYRQLEQDSEMDPLPYKKKVQPTRNLGKGKAKALTDVVFEEEYAYVMQVKNEEADEKNARIAEALEEKELQESGMGIECGCCFGEYAFEKMIQCPDAHLFCQSCAKHMAEEAIGNRKIELVCMDQSGCKMPFPLSEIQRFLPPKTLQLWERIKAEKSLEQAAIEGLESCPFCSYSVVIENPNERLFRCEAEECGAVSCRECKKVDHLPKTCKACHISEVDADRKLDAKHAVEEAMTAALTRKCPKCSNPFVKTDGCNKITCPTCRTLSCYICREIITGYEHFGNPQGPKEPGKCDLWDPVERRGHDEVAAAAKLAQEQYLASHPDAKDEDVKVDLPVGPKAPPASAPGPAPHVHHHGAAHALAIGGHGQAHQFQLQVPVPVRPPRNDALPLPMYHRQPVRPRAARAPPPRRMWR